jgi:hypothetical protein
MISQMIRQKRNRTAKARNAMDADVDTNREARERSLTADLPGRQIRNPKLKALKVMIRVLNPQTGYM